MAIYTMETWRQDQTFNADPGQEITAEVYNQMLNALPPESLPAEKAQEVLTAYGLPIHEGFLMGEPHSSDGKGNLLYLAFGRNDYGKGQHYYYLGLSKAETPLEGIYYYFDSLENIGNGNIKPAVYYEDDREAIRQAADIEATLYKCEYKNGDQVTSCVLYEPEYC